MLVNFYAGSRKELLSFLLDDTVNVGPGCLFFNSNHKPRQAFRWLKIFDTRVKQSAYTSWLVITSGCVKNA